MLHLFPIRGQTAFALPEGVSLIHHPFPSLSRGSVRKSQELRNSIHTMFTGPLVTFSSPVPFLSKLFRLNKPYSTSQE